MDTSFSPIDIGNGAKAYAGGLLGSLASLPFNHSTRFIMALGGRGDSDFPGIAGAVKQWGDRMLHAYKKDAVATRSADATLHTLGCKPRLEAS